MKIEIIVILHYVVLILMSIILLSNKSKINLLNIETKKLQREIKTLKKELELIQKDNNQEKEETFKVVKPSNNDGWQI